MKNAAATAVFVAALAGSGAAFQWPTEAIYNKWHETKLEKWLKDHNIPYPAASDRKSLYNTVEEHWNKITPPYDQWSEKQLRDWLVESGSNAADIAASKKDDLVGLIKSSYEESTDGLASWILDSWTDSQLKSFLDYHNIPNPTPRNRDSVLQKARHAYSNMASIGPSVYDSLFSQWTDSDLKAWCDTNGIPVPQGSTKESMLASMRKNTATFTEQAKAKIASMYNGASDAMFDTWSESQLKDMLDQNGVPVPQGSKVNELRALARKNYKSLKNSASEYYAEGASSVSSVAGVATDAAAAAASDASALAGKLGKSAQKSAESAASVASQSAASAATDASALAGKLGKSAQKSAQSAASVASKSAESAASDASALAGKLGKSAQKSAQSAASVASKSAESAASEASKTMGKVGKDAKKSVDSAASEASKTAGKMANDAKAAAGQYAADGKKSADSLYGEASKSATSAYGKATDAASETAEDVLGSDNTLYKLWSDSRLKSFLDARGIPVPQNGKKDELVALVRENSHKARLAAEDFEGWSSSELQKFAKESKIKLSKTAADSREELVKQTQKGYTEMQKKGDDAYTAAEKAYNAIKGYAYDTWSDSDLKSYLDSYGVSVPQSTTKDQLIAMARKNGHYFSSGQTGPAYGSPLTQMALDGMNSLMDFIKKASGVGYNKGAEVAEGAKEKAKAEL